MTTFFDLDKLATLYNPEPSKKLPENLPEIFFSKLDPKGELFASLALELTGKDATYSENLKECLTLLHFALQLKLIDWHQAIFLSNFKLFDKMFEHFASAHASSSSQPQIIIYLEQLFANTSNKEKLKFIDSELDDSKEIYQKALKDLILNINALRENFSTKKPTDLKNGHIEFTLRLSQIINKMLLISLSLICFYSNQSINFTLEKMFGGIYNELVSPTKTIAPNPGRRKSIFATPEENIKSYLAAKAEEDKAEAEAAKAKTSNPTDKKTSPPQRRRGSGVPPLGLTSPALPEVREDKTPSPTPSPDKLPEIAPRDTDFPVQIS